MDSQQAETDTDAGRKLTPEEILAGLVRGVAGTG